MAKDNKKLVEAITSMDVDFAQWYTDVVKKAELCDYASVKGCMVIKPDGYALWENIQNELDNLKRDRIYTAQEKTERETKLKAELAAAKAVEEKNKGQINKLIADAEAYLKAHYDSDYYQAVVASCKQEKVQAQQKYQATVEQLKKEHETALSKLSNQQEIKDEKYVHKNRLFDAKMQLDKDCQAIKDLSLIHI